MRGIFFGQCYGRRIVREQIQTAIDYLTSRCVFVILILFIVPAFTHVVLFACCPIAVTKLRPFTAKSGNYKANNSSLLYLEDLKPFSLVTNQSSVREPKHYCIVKHTSTEAQVWQAGLGGIVVSSAVVASVLR